MRLPPEIAASGYRLITLEATDSTNSDAAAAAHSGDPGRLWVVAREQRTGRGRHGRTWTSPPGNLYASLLLVEPCPPAAAAQLGFVAGLALHEAVAAETGLDAPRLALKWPNDLLLDGGKLAGVLLEGHYGAERAFSLVIGFGINIVAAPAATPYPASALRTVGSDLTAESLFASLSRAFARRFDAWRDAEQNDQTEPFESIREQWLARAAGLGDVVTIRLPDGDRSGAFRGLDQAGRLQLQTHAGMELIDAGDLYFSRLRSADAPPGPSASG